MFYYTEVAFVAGGIVVPRVLSWRRNRHAKREENPIFMRLLPTVHSPLFFRVIVEIERFALQAAILDAMSVKST